MRFNTHQIDERTDEYCLPKIVENINKLGGVEEGRIVGRRIDLDAPGGLQQLLLDDKTMRPPGTVDECTKNGEGGSDA